MEISSLSTQRTPVEWVGNRPNGEKKVALLIPQFNEAIKPNFARRLDYFKGLSEQFGSLIDVILVDDGSTDNSSVVLTSFKARNENAFFLALIKPNMKKVGALYATALEIHHEFVVLSDFDTDILGLRFLFEYLSLSSINEKNLMGCYFRMLPFEGNGNIFLFQQLEYAMARSCYKLYERENTVPVMPGAGCCYRRQLLIFIYERHSGLRNGEDREATLIGLKLGYKTAYLDSVLSLTRPPTSFKSLITQRVRWNLGYIETICKEDKFYAKQIRTLTLLGMRTLYDVLRVKFILLLPVFILAGALVSWKVLLATLGVVYFVYIFWCLNAIFLAPHESLEFKDKRFKSILLYPFFKVPLDLITWSFAIVLFLKEKVRN